MTSELSKIRRLRAGDIALFRQLNALFADCFDDRKNYLSNPPSDDYLNQLLETDRIIAIVAMVEDRIVGGLVAYELEKFEQQRREVYIYDLAVDESFRRRGLATAMIKEVCNIARQRDGWVVYVQADYGDEPAIALYSKLGRREDVLHFDIAP